MRFELTTSFIESVAKLFDDSQATRLPSHSDIKYQVSRNKLNTADPIGRQPPVGKMKRVREILSWAMDNDSVNGSNLILSLVQIVRGCGGFNSNSINYVGEDAIDNFKRELKIQGYLLHPDGVISKLLLDNLSGIELNNALRAYIRRAQAGSFDAALVTGTGKDLLEATAAYVLQEVYGDYSEQANFPTLLGQAFVALKLATPMDKNDSGPMSRLERCLYNSGCAVNNLRNKQGTGHGRPWLSTVKDHEAKVAIQQIGVISEYLLDKLVSTF
jgi:hypothetical protein